MELYDKIIEEAYNSGSFYGILGGGGASVNVPDAQVTVPADWPRVIKYGIYKAYDELGAPVLDMYEAAIREFCEKDPWIAANILYFQLDQELKGKSPFRIKKELTIKLSLEIKTHKGELEKVYPYGKNGWNKYEDIQRLNHIFACDHGYGFMNSYIENSANIQEIYNKIIDYGWNTPGNNWAGHHFKTTDGFEVKTLTVPGHYGPEGETVSIYKNNVRLYSFTYMLDTRDTTWNILKPIIKYIKANIGCNNDYATAVAEYLYGMEKLRPVLDILKGLILLDGFRITKHTAREEMQHFFSDDKGFLAGNYVICQKPKHVNGQAFVCRLWFKPDGRIGHIKLTLFPLPVTEEEKKDRAKLQKALYRASESWLNWELGEPTKETETSVSYEYDWGSIGCFVDEGLLSNYDGGSIIIAYR